MGQRSGRPSFLGCTRMSRVTRQNRLKRKSAGGCGASARAVAVTDIPGVEIDCRLGGNAVGEGYLSLDEFYRDACHCTARD